MPQAALWGRETPRCSLSGQAAPSATSIAGQSSSGWVKVAPSLSHKESRAFPVGEVYRLCQVAGAFAIQVVSKRGDCPGG